MVCYISFKRIMLRFTNKGSLMVVLLQHGFRNCWQLYRNVCLKTFPGGYPNNIFIEAYWGRDIEVALLFRNNWGCCIAAALFDEHNCVSWGQPIISVKLSNPPVFINVARGSKWQNWQLWDQEHQIKDLTEIAKH